VLRIFPPLKIPRFRPGLNPRTLVPEASTLTPRPSKPLLGLLEIQNTFKEACTSFPTVYQPSQYSGNRKGYTKRGLTNIRRYRTILSRRGDLAPRICAPLPLSNKIIYFTNKLILEHQFPLSQYFLELIIRKNRNRDRSGVRTALRIALFHNEYCVNEYGQTKMNTRNRLHLFRHTCRFN
jgi:hypothetical protein